MRTVIKGFDWDAGNYEKCQKHGVGVEDIEKLFLGGNFYVGPDSKHSDIEQRFLAIGKTDQNRHVIVAFTFRNAKDGLLLRPISARYMHMKEVESYEKAFA